MMMKFLASVSWYINHPKKFSPVILFAVVAT